MRDQRGVTAVLFGFMAVGAMGTAGLTVDVGQVFVSKKAFDAATQSAALAGAHALLQNNATLSTVRPPSRPGTPQIRRRKSRSPTPTWRFRVTRDGKSADLQRDNRERRHGDADGDGVDQLPQGFRIALGHADVVVEREQSGRHRGAIERDVRARRHGSMNSADAGCTVPGITHPTRFQCAEYSVQSILKTMPTSLDKAGLMIFPGMATQYSPTSHPCPNQPNSTPYYTANIKYQIGTTLDATYNNGAGALINSSPLVQAVGNGTSTPVVTGCVTAKGGEGSYAAEVLTKAKAALPVVAGTQNVIIFLSDGDFNASASQLSNTAAKRRSSATRRSPRPRPRRRRDTRFTLSPMALRRVAAPRATPTIPARRCRRSRPTRPGSTRPTPVARCRPRAVLPPVITTTLTKPRLVVK